MLKIAPLVLAALATFAPFAAAENCKYDLDYCGWTLFERGNYYNAIVDALEINAVEFTQENIEQSLFHCDGGEGEISYIEDCSACNEGEFNESDYC